MTDPTPQTDATRGAEDASDRPTPGTPDMAVEQLTGTDSGSDTRAGSLRGGSASGSDDDPDSDVINAALAAEGQASADPQSPASVGPDAIKNTGATPGGSGEDPAEGKRDGEADAATG